MSGRLAVLLGALVAIAVIALAFTFVALDGDDDGGGSGSGTTPAEASRDQTSDLEQVTGERFDGLALREGECFDVVSVPREIELVPCGAIPSAQVSAVLESEAAGDDDFPGDEVVAEEAERRCEDAFDSFVPDADAWEGGDRVLVCLAPPPED